MTFLFNPSYVYNFESNDINIDLERLQIRGKFKENFKQTVATSRSQLSRLHG